MKRINMKAIISGMFMLALAISCTDLNVPVRSQLTSFPDSDAALDAASGTAYGAYRNAYGVSHFLVETVSSDEVVWLCFGNDWYDGGQYCQMHFHNWTSDNPHLARMWEDAMTGVTSCNTVLALIGDDESEKAAPIRAMRAFYYFMLMDNFGSAPILEGLMEEQPDRAPRSEVCKFVESELLSIIDKLTTTVDASTYGRPTRYMAEALLAKVYLNWPVYMNDDVAAYEGKTASNEKLNDLVKLCDDIIQSGQFNLNDNFLVKFRPDNGPQIKDFIFVMAYDRLKVRYMRYGRYWIHRSAQKQFGDLPQSVGGTLRVLPDFYDKFNLPGDERNKMFLTGKQYYWENYQETDRPFMINTSKRGIDQDYNGSDADEKFDWQLELVKDIKLRPGGEMRLDGGNDQKGRSMGYRSIKFYMDTEVTVADGRNQSNDVPVFRYADILLMKAEAILRGANSTLGDTPASLMNQIRAYVNAPEVTGNPTLEELLDERAREFTDESWRRNDLIRFGKFEDHWGFRDLYPEGYTEKFRRIFPVPLDVMNVNTNWKQNPGY